MTSLRSVWWLVGGTVLLAVFAPTSLPLAGVTFAGLQLIGGTRSRMSRAGALLIGCFALWALVIPQESAIDAVVGVFQLFAAVAFVALAWSAPGPFLSRATAALVWSGVSAAALAWILNGAHTWGLLAWDTVRQTSFALRTVLEVMSRRRGGPVREIRAGGALFQYGASRARGAVGICGAGGGLAVARPDRAGSAGTRAPAVPAVPAGGRRGLGRRRGDHRLDRFGESPGHPHRRAERRAGAGRAVRAARSGRRRGRGCDHRGSGLGAGAGGVFGAALRPGDRAQSLRPGRDRYLVGVPAPAGRPAELITRTSWKSFCGKTCSTSARPARS